MERRAARLKAEGKTEADVIHTEIFRINADIRKYNCILEGMQRKIEAKQKVAALSARSKAERLKDVSDQLVIVRTNRKRLRDALIKTSSALESIQSRLDTYNQSIREANGKIREHIEILADLREELSLLSIKDKKYKTLAEDIQTEQDIIIRLQGHIRELKDSYGYSDEALYEQDQKDAYRYVEDLKNIEEKISELSRTEDALKEQYREVKFSMEASDDTDDDRYYSDNSYDDYVECIVDDIVGMTGMLTRAFDDKRKKKRR